MGNANSTKEPNAAGGKVRHNDNEKEEEKEEEEPVHREYGFPVEESIDPRKPDAAWEILSKVVTVNPFQPLEFSSVKKEGTVRFVCVSDTHSLHHYIKEMPDGDVFVHAGDFSNVGEPKDIKALADWLRSLTQYKYKIVIAGNHDLTFDRKEYGEKM